MTIGELIKYERIRNHLSQEDVARAIGSTKQAVYKYENGIVTNIPMERTLQNRQRRSLSTALTLTATCLNFLK